MSNNSPTSTPVDMTAEFFHVCEGVYRSGDRKPAGTYGALVQGAPADEVAADELGEHLRERIRAEHYPDKPRRLASTFVWETLEDAVWFRDQFRQKSAVYKVRFLDSTVQAHKVCHTAFRMSASRMDPPAEFMAHEFWARPPVYASLSEVFAESGIEILALCVSAPP
ncbi:hypothetical protein ABT392_14515 [Paucibacter sp. JuS9]|uniref:hypothetical protein n=1 Tax=Paucibacter sp. JuS9 TaxID=3228748 RepID=UPI003756876C